MFDLFRSRAKAVRYLLGALLMLVAISMVVTLIPGFGGGGGGANDQVVAEIGDDAVTVREVNQQVQNAIRNKTIPRELIQIYVPQMIDEMITQRALVYKAQQMGFRVTEEDIAKDDPYGVPAAIPGRPVRRQGNLRGRTFGAEPDDSGV